MGTPATIEVIYPGKGAPGNLYDTRTFKCTETVERVVRSQDDIENTKYTIFTNNQKLCLQAIISKEDVKVRSDVLYSPDFRQDKAKDEISWAEVPDKVKSAVASVDRSIPWNSSFPE